MHKGEARRGETRLTLWRNLKIRFWNQKKKKKERQNCKYKLVTIDRCKKVESMKIRGDYNGLGHNPLDFGARHGWCCKYRSAFFSPQAMDQIDRLLLLLLLLLLYVCVYINPNKTKSAASTWGFTFLQPFILSYLFIYLCISQFMKML